jgi:hypothetical protein
MMPVDRKTAISIASMMVVLLASGCSQRTVERGCRVTGTVTVGGKPASGASVRFFDEGQCVGAGTTDDTGKYTAVDVPRKSFKVAVEEGASTGPYASAPPPGTTPLPGSLSGPPTKIPAKFQKVDSSGLTATVTQDPQTIDFTLE